MVSIQRSREINDVMSWGEIFTLDHIPKHGKLQRILDGDPDLECSFGEGFEEDGVVEIVVAVFAEGFEPESFRTGDFGDVRMDAHDEGFGVGVDGVVEFEEGVPFAVEHTVPETLEGDQVGGSGLGASPLLSGGEAFGVAFALHGVL